MLAELLEAFEPVVSTVLVAITDEEEVEEFMDLREGLLLGMAGVEEGGGGYDGVIGGHGGKIVTRANGHGTMRIEDGRHVDSSSVCYSGDGSVFYIVLEDR